ncbi:uncharacterized protein TNCV_4654101 [Trichonephila clavipes]|nr:uncharacterized protein TNCV_4654101 [Trichonephila clavipes]
MNQTFIWHQDREPLHWHLSVSDWLNITALDQSIFRKGSHDKACFTWPPRLPDLSPCDFYLWGFIKDCVYVLPLPADLPDERHRIGAAISRITAGTKFGMNSPIDLIFSSKHLMCINPTTRWVFSATNTRTRETPTTSL